MNLSAAERLVVFYWFASLKAMFARQFNHFFKPLGNSGDLGKAKRQQRH